MPARDEVGSLNLIQNTRIKIKHIEQGEIATHSDDKCIIKECHKEVNKASDCAKEVDGVLEHIWREVESIKFDVTLECSNNKPNPTKELH